MAKSPLRFPGGKTRALKVIAPFIPFDKIKSLCSPFIGGGSVELYCESRGIKVSGYDVFSPLVDFWTCLLENPELLAKKVSDYYPLSREKFYELQKTLTEYTDTYDRAAIFYVLNRCSFSGTSLSGGMSPGHPRFTPSSIKRIKDFKAPDLSVGLQSFEKTLARTKEDFIFLDPPYLISSMLYGNKGDTHRGFNHQLLAEILSGTDKPWILCYNDCEEIREMYKLYKIYTLSWKYGMNKNKQSSEILIVKK